MEEAQDVSETQERSENPVGTGYHVQPRARMLDTTARQLGTGDRIVNLSHDVNRRVGGDKLHETFLDTTFTVFAMKQPKVRMGSRQQLRVSRNSLKNQSINAIAKMARDS